MVSFSALGRLSALLVAATASTMGFDHYLSSFNKVYSGAEYVKRQDLFAARLKEIEVHNSNPFSTYKMGVNQFTDMTDAERASFLGRAHNPKRTLTEASFKVADGELPNTVDWRKEGVVTPVKNQGHCGSCWAFATTATVESAVAIATGKLLVLSPQNVVSCTPNNNHCGGQGGCNGATAELGFTYVMNHGIALESTYPYKAETGTCMMDRPKAAFTTATVALAENNQEALINAVATVGPIAISVDATPWHSYQSGIFDGCSRNATLNHLVQLVGYGEEKGVKYWLVRNSWDTTWGEQGYIRVKRFDNGRDYCGTDNNPSAGSGCDGGPPTVPVCGMCGILYDSSYPIGASVATH